MYPISHGEHKLVTPYVLKNNTLDCKYINAMLLCYKIDSIYLLLKRSKKGSTFEFI
jgi:hypothetical protein